MKEISEVKFRSILCPVAYLLTPKQRTITRFMNIDATITWAVDVLNNFSQLTKEEQDAFEFLHKYQDLILELNKLSCCTNKILKNLKESGLSVETSNATLLELDQLQKSDNIRLSSVGNELAIHIQQKQQKLSHATTDTSKEIVWHCSSDVIESLFGYYKRIKSPNPMNGVTKQVFLLSFMTFTCLRRGGIKNININDFLVGNTLEEIDDWAKNISP
ncbi:MAG: hypothetical protein LBJ00_01480 [Planctomycetaceae bacterium]|jgi:hypothetical protein|nr:hypothetical protein [Planctomycetaceae bacterium]